MLIKVSILKATYRVPIRSVEADDVVNFGIAASEVEAARPPRVANCTTPISAVGADSVERTTTAVSAGARHGQFKGRVNSACRVDATPCKSLIIQFRLGWYTIPNRARVVCATYPLP